MADVTQVKVARVHDRPVCKLAGVLNNGPPLLHPMRVTTLAC